MIDLDTAIPDIDPITPIQAQLYDDWEHRFYVCPAGRRSRKTLIFSRKLLIHALENANHKYFQGAPTQDQAEAIFWKPLKEATRPFWKRQPRETNKIVYLMNGTEIEVHGLDKPARVEGRPWHGCHITEINNCKADTWDEHVEPCLIDTKGFAYLDGVPEAGRDWYYTLALNAAGGVLPAYDEDLQGSFAENGKWAYYHWKSSSVLDAADLAEKKERLDLRIYRQEYEGSYESFGGAAYYNFGDWNLKSYEYNPLAMVHIGMDFNVNPMTATLNQLRIEKVTGREVAFQFGEIWLPDSNTPEMIAAIKKLFPTHMCIIYPDATGGSRTTTGSKTNLDLLYAAGFTLRYRDMNPQQADRAGAVNSIMKSATGKIGYFIDPRCKHTIDDYNRVTRHDDGRIVKKEGSLLTHISDAQGYFLYYKFPIRQSKVEKG